MSEDKKVAEEKRYAQISKESIKFMADSIGVANLDDEIASLLAEDVNYRLREVAQNCGQFMRHSKRRKLSVRDFNKALRWSDIEPIYGYNCSETATYHYCKEAEVHYVEEKEITLLDLALNTPVYQKLGPPCVKAQWLAVEGIAKSSTSSQTTTGKKSSHVSPTICDDLMVYYDQMTKAILGNDEELMKVALEDLKTNSKIAPLLPYLVNFVSVGVKKVSHDLAQLTKLLYTVHALIGNQSLYLGPTPYLNLLTQGLLYCILEPLAASINPVNDHWALRDYAARLLAQVIRIWTTPANRLYDECLEALQEVIIDHTKPFCSHYGAVVAMIALGPRAIHKHLLPHILKYWPHLISVVDDIRYFNVQVKTDAHKVYGALLLAAMLTMNHERQLFLLDQISSNALPIEEPDDGFCDEVKMDIKEEAKSPKADSCEKPWPTKIEDRSVSRIYEALYECFGDSLASRLAYVPIVNLYRKPKKPLLNLFTCPESLQSGEELLEAFSIKDEEWQSGSADDDHSYDERDDNSLLSDDGEVETETGPANVDLRIKSTVSDPTLGIKLTIAKLPRSFNPEPNDFGGRSAKRKKLSIKIKKEQLEPIEPEPVFVPTAKVERRTVDIEFCFAGSTPLPKERLKRNVILPMMEAMPFSEYFRLCLRLKKSGHKKCRFSKHTWSRKFSTGSLHVVI